jgi:hypothetical protein
MAQVMPGESAAPTGVQAAAAYMRELLLRPGPYRRKWEQYAQRARQGQVNQLAVAEVLAHYLREHPRAQGDLDVLARQLKDTASRALSGKLLSKATLVLFSEAFGLGALEREHLLKLWEGSTMSACCPARERSARTRRACSAARNSRRSPSMIITISGPMACRSSTALST